MFRPGGTGGLMLWYRRVGQRQRRQSIGRVALKRLSDSLADHIVRNLSLALERRKPIPQVIHERGVQKVSRTDHRLGQVAPGLVAMSRHQYANTAEKPCLFMLDRVGGRLCRLLVGFLCRNEDRDG